MKKITLLGIIAITLLQGVVFGDNLSTNIPAALNIITTPNFIDNEKKFIQYDELEKALGIDIDYNQKINTINMQNDLIKAEIKLLDDNIKLNESGLLLQKQNNDLFFFVKAVGENSALEELFETITPTGPLCSRLINGGAVLNNTNPQTLLALVKASISLKNGQATLQMDKNQPNPIVLTPASVKKSISNNLLLVNKYNSLAHDSMPANLSNTGKIKAAVAKGCDRICAEVLPSLTEMFEGASKDGIKNFVIVSSYRPYEKQQSLFLTKLKALIKKKGNYLAAEEAQKVVALPGTSEHQTGLALDVVEQSIKLIPAFDSTPQGKWLAENSWKYGFVIRYPQNKTGITGIIYEPWHIRYVGRIHAEIMHQKQWCLEEYINNLKTNKYLQYKDIKGDNYIVHYLTEEELSHNNLILRLNSTSEWFLSNCESGTFILTIKL